MAKPDLEKFDPKVAIRTLSMRLRYEEIQALDELFQNSSCKKKIDFYRLILRLGSEAYKASNPDP